MAAKLAEAEAAGEKLRFVGTVDVVNKTASVELRRFPNGHPFTTLQGSDNIVGFITSRYTEDSSLIVRGPGAGAEVTAAGVFAHILRLCVAIFFVGRTERRARVCLLFGIELRRARLWS